MLCVYLLCCEGKVSSHRAGLSPSLQPVCKNVVCLLVLVWCERKDSSHRAGLPPSPKLACVNAVCVFTYCGVKGSSDEHCLESLEENNNDDDDDDTVHAVLFFPLQQTHSAFAACRPK